VERPVRGPMTRPSRLPILRLLVPLAAVALGACAAPPAAPPASTTALPHATALDWTHGWWTGVRRDADGENVIHVHVTPLLGGAGTLREMWVELEDGGTYRGMSVQLQDQGSGAWTRSYANDARGRLVTLRSRPGEAGPPGGDAHVWRGDFTPEGRASENRSERLGDDGWRSTVRRTRDGGATWEVVFVDELRRSGPFAPR